MKSLVVMVVMLVLCWVMTDVRSESTLFNVLAPLGVVIFGFALLLWITFALAARRITNNPANPPQVTDFLGSNGGSDELGK